MDPPCFAVRPVPDHAAQKRWCSEPRNLFSDHLAFAALLLLQRKACKGSLVQTFGIALQPESPPPSPLAVGDIQVPGLQ